MLKQNLSQKLLQKLSPQQIQLMKLLQIPTANLDQRIKEELEANPALEETEDREDPFELSREDESPADQEDRQEDESLDYDSDIESLDEVGKESEFEMEDYLNEYIEDDPTSYK